MLLRIYRDAHWRGAFLRISAWIYQDKIKAQYKPRGFKLHNADEEDCHLIVHFVYNTSMLPRVFGGIYN